MKIIKLEIDENSILAGLDAMALVEAPAIQEDFYYFSEEKFAETYSDYPEAAIEAAKMGIKRNEEIGNKCATQVGKVRAQQLANREPISLDTIRRMRSFLIRQKGNYDLAVERKDYEACGYISYLLWGGESALPWAEKKLRQAGETFGQEDPTKTIIEGIIKHEMGKIQDLQDLVSELFEFEVSTLPEYSNEVSGSIEVSEASYGFAAIEEQQMVVGPAMKANKLIKRLDDNGNEYYVYFTEETIKKIAYKMMADKVIDKVNIEHDGNRFVDGAHLVESWIVEDPSKDKSTLYGFKPNVGDWYTMYKIEDKNIWNEYIKSGKVKGFSIEGWFNEKLPNN